jgi:hypothetical protein
MKDEQIVPFQSRNGHEDFNKPTMGLTKRQWYAGVALQGLLSNPSFDKAGHEDLAMVAVHAADALCAELSK